MSHLLTGSVVKLGLAGNLGACLWEANPWPSGGDSAGRAQMPSMEQGGARRDHQILGVIGDRQRELDSGDYVVGWGGLGREGAGRRLTPQRHFFAYVIGAQCGVWHIFIWKLEAV